MAQQTIDLAPLRAELKGTAVVAGDEDWDRARAAWNLAADRHPVAAVYAEDADDVAATISFARDNALRVAPQGTGHAAQAGSELDRTVLVRTERMNATRVDAEARVGRFEAGVLSRDAGNAAAEHGLAAYLGSSPDVGIVGYTVGGGLGWLSRRHGLACNNVRAIELVTAEGERKRIDSGSDPDLFWALRGGGGSFAIVTAIEFDLVALPEVFAGAVIYPAEQRSGEILRRYFEWTQAVPDEVTSLARFLHPPPRPEIPEPMRDRHLIMLAACYAGPETEGAAALNPLRELGEAVMDRFAAMPPSQLAEISMDPEQPVPAMSHTTSLRSMPEDAIDAFVETAGPDAGSPLVNAELRHAGGALAEPAEGGGALARIDAAYVFSGTGVPIPQEAGEAVNRQIDTICDALRPWSTGRCFYNFVGRPIGFEEIHDPGTVERLREMKQRYDPNDLIVANIAIDGG